MTDNRNSDATDDILSAIYSLRCAFHAAGISPPDVLLLPDADAGRRFLMELKQSDRMIMLLRGQAAPSPSDLPPGVTVHRVGEIERVIENPDGTAWWEVDLDGVVVRWPVTLAPLPAGGFEFTL